jgi:hypothetical protein
MDSYLLVNEAIDAYTAHGWSVIPIRSGDKRPLVRWEQFQYRRPRVEEVHAWFPVGLRPGSLHTFSARSWVPGHGRHALVTQ